MRRIPSTSIVIILGLTSACVAQDQALDITDTFAGMPEIERLHYYEAIDLQPAFEEFQLSGEGVRITIMGEMVDAAHPEISTAVNQQFNAFAMPGEVIPGEGNQPFRQELLDNGDGHGTHIAGTIAAACDDVGMLGIACGATLDVYDLGAYDNSDAYIIEDSKDDDETAGFLGAFATAMRDVTRRGESKITTGSFNLEAPALRFTSPVSPDFEEIMEVGGSRVSQLEQTLSTPPFTTVMPEDLQMLARVVEANDDDMFIAAMALASQTDGFQQVAEAIAEYQNSGGVYIITESNYRFEDRTSVLNALPSLSDIVDPGLWLSVVMVEPEGLETAETEEEVETARNGRYIAPINGCGTMAQEYCIVTPSYMVLSSMTERVSEDRLPLFNLDGRSYQLFSGHSMGAPMVAATLALMQEKNQNDGLGLSMRDLVRILKENANRDFVGYNPVEHGVGMLDVAAAIRAMAG